MALQPGRMLAHYRLAEKIGEGGMGVVWRAEDTKLGRDVAIKVLPEAVGSSPDRLARFEREARVLASLRHPSIAAIHAFEHADGLHFLVMELVAGEDLHQRIARGALPVDEVLPIALHIASALEAAHEQGIVHRDLKPANIKITASGEARVLDFGLAKALAADDSGSGSQSLMPTVSSPVTQTGVIMGTPSYMSPEQAKGRPADRRSDIWSFGVILYEMLTGRRLFRGDTVSEKLASVLRDEVQLASLPPETPDSVRRVMGRCLDRDPRRRLQWIGEARVILEGARSGEGDADLREAAGPPAAVRTFRMMIAGVSLLAAGFAAGFLMPWGAGSKEPAGPGRARTFIEKAPDRPIEEPPRGGPVQQAISPNGRWIAWVGQNRLWLRNIEELRGRSIPGSEGARGLFWSPRSDAVAFSAGNRILKYPVNGAEPVPLCRFSGGDFTGGSWSGTAGIVFTISRANWNGEILRIPEEGGEPEPFEVAPLAEGERRLYQPHFLPDGRSLLYTMVTLDANRGELAVEQDGVRRRLGLGEGSCQAAWSPTGHLVFTRSLGQDSSLWAASFDLATLSLTGEPFRLAASAAGASAAADGTLLYELRHPEPEQLAWVDRTGRVLDRIGEPVQANIWTPAVSPDGTRVAATIDWKDLTVWEMNRGIHAGITGEDEITIYADWMPGGEEIAYMSLGERGSIVARRADGSGRPRPLLEMPGAAVPSFSSDGAWMVFYVVDFETGRDIWAVRTDKLDEPFTLLRTPANEAMPRISPDGSLLAYQSDVSGRWEVYLRPFPEGEGRWQVSTEGGFHPRWNPRGGEIFFVSGENMMAASITSGPEVRVAPPVTLFNEEMVGTRLSLPRHVEFFYDVAPDGNKFLVILGVESGTSEIVVAEGALSSHEGAAP